MSYKVSDIVHENGDFWVLRDRKGKCYTVFKTGPTYSTSDSAYTLDEDGLSIAKARCDYLARRAAERAAREAQLTALLSPERECCGTFKGSHHRATCPEYRGKF